MKKEQLHNIKDSGLTVPNNYFEALEDDIATTIKLNSITETAGFAVPKDYFNTFEVKSNKTKRTKVINLFNTRNIAYAASIAAAILLFFNLNLFNNTLNINDIDTVAIDKYILDETTSNDLTLLLDNNILAETQFIDYNFNNDNIDLFLENESIDDLITE